VELPAGDCFAGKGAEPLNSRILCPVDSGTSRVLSAEDTGRDADVLLIGVCGGFLGCVSMASKIRPDLDKSFRRLPQLVVV